MGARPPIVFFQQLRDLGTVLISDPIFYFDNKHWEYLIDASSQDISSYLPPATGSRHMLRPKKVDVSSHIVNIFAYGTDLIDDSGSIVLSGQWADAWLIDAAPGLWDNTGSSFRQAVPPDGSTGQFLAKSSDADYDMAWINPPSGTFVQLSARPISFNDFLSKGDASGWWP